MAENHDMSNILHSPQERPDVLVHVAANVRRLRAAAGLSQAALAEAAEVSRRMLVNIEKGDVNVSLNTLDRLAAVLDVAFYTLVAPPENEDAARIDEVVWAGTDVDSQARLLASKAAREQVELWSWSMAPGEVYASDADPAGWANMIVVLSGRLTVTLGEARFTIAAGDFRIFPSDRPHRYANQGDALLRFVRNVVY
ncbi:helix-turn-helix domain-containing protein [Salinisphaera sp.]|uniref:helix-turn-helix domain-containing protein n=1 Tax=Salinisphaera sp. TaxID=1914330 RepID=UPI002D782A3B|nr:XRE family transcriptional regulator [Salinisphaera sp.]HET7315323.1 XRE family transcriptional regulator [Salinisphaera sp.]